MTAPDKPRLSSIFAEDCAMWRHRAEAAERERDEARAENERLGKQWWETECQLKALERRAEELRRALEEIEAQTDIDPQGVIIREIARAALHGESDG